ncbi:hypothetical protein SF12_08710, partial [Streptomyces sp. MBRL 601]
LARRTGIRPLDPDLAVLALRQVVTGSDPVAVVADVDPDRFVRAFTTVRPSSLLAEMPRTPPSRRPRPPPTRPRTLVRRCATGWPGSPRAAVPRWS